MTETATLRLPDDFPAEMRLDHALVILYPQHSRSFLQQAIKNGALRWPDGTPCKCSEPVQAGTVLIGEIPQPENVVPQAEELPLEILYEDEDLLVIDKQAGVVVHPAPGNAGGTIVNALLAKEGESFRRMQDDDLLRPGIVHRLDRDTSGVLVIAKNSETQLALQEQFRQHQVKKLYLAVLVGTMPEPHDTIHLALGRDVRNRLKWAVVPENEGKLAITEYKTLQSFKGYSLVEIRLHTGRTHQIRVHFSHFGHPVLGDTLYGAPRKNAPKRQMLHAWKIAFTHPRTQETMKIEAPIPRDFRRVLTILRAKGNGNDLSASRS